MNPESIRRTSEWSMYVPVFSVSPGNAIYNPVYFRNIWATTRKPCNRKPEVRLTELKKKDEKPSDTFCFHCGAKETPEWRRGPLGRRTLCNACGLLYAARLKRGTKEVGKLSFVLN